MNLRAAAVLGAVVGVAYTLSPLTAVLAVALVPLLRWAARGTEGSERRWLLSILIVGVAVRVLAVALLLLMTRPELYQFRAFVPDARFAIARSWWIRNQWLGIEIGPVYRLGVYSPYGATSYAYVLAALQLVFGEAPYAVNFVATGAFLFAAIALYRVARESYGPAPALIGLVILLFWPTMIIWSVSALRESFQLALTSAVIVAVVHAARGRTVGHRVAAGAGVAVALAALNPLHAGALVIASGGVAVAVVGWVLTARPVVARTVAIALVVGLGWAATRPAVQQRFVALMKPAVTRHVGEVQTPGNSYHILDYRFYRDNVRTVINTMTPGEALDFVIQSAWAFFLVPLPWQLASATEIAFFPQQVLWLAMIAAAVVGAVAGFRRDRLLTWLLVGYVAVAVAVIAPFSGNIGTLIRHRDIIIPAMTWLSAIGLCAVIGWQARRREAPAGSPNVFRKVMA